MRGLHLSLLNLIFQNININNPLLQGINSCKYMHIYIYLLFLLSFESIGDFSL